MTQNKENGNILGSIDVGQHANSGGRVVSGESVESGLKRDVQEKLSLDAIECIAMPLKSGSTTKK